MTKPLGTAALVSLAREGDREAFDELSRLVRSRSLAAVRRMTGDVLRQRVDAEDVLQEALLRGFAAIDRLEGEDLAAFGAWIEGIARNVVRNLARRRALKSEFRIDRDPPASATSPSRHERRVERFQRLSDAVAALSPDHRRVVQLARIEGLKIREVAGRMGRSEDAVKSLLLRAMRELRCRIEDTESLRLPDRQLGEEPESNVE